ncbi:MAG TPA: ABC transporter permease [Polyangiaceae bacterium]|nr:ABC transporter permease [Polyangiaceae bacterium]
MKRPWLRALLPLALVLVLGLVFNGNGAFFEWQTHRALLREISVHGVLACGLTLVIVAGGIDLSVGSVLALSAVSFSLLTMHAGLTSGLALVIVLAVGLVAGLVSGALVAFARIQAFIVTLAMMVFARGLAKQLSGGQKVSHYFAAPDGHFVNVEPPRLFALVDSRVLADNLSVVTLVFAACAVACYVVLARLRVGRFLYAIGGNWDAARLSGVPVRLAALFAYAASGFLSALAGVCQAAQETQGDPETGLGYELDAIAMVVLGGTSLAGGRGGIGLTLIGALTLGYLQKVLSLNAYSTEVRLMLTGVILIGAVLFQRRRA